MMIFEWAYHNGYNTLTIIEALAEFCAVIIELFGIFIVTGLALYALVFAAFRLYERVELRAVFLQVRQRLGRGILLGLEFFIAADIIRIVAIELETKKLLPLAFVVLIRTFLSFTLEIELTGHWPWHNETNPSG